MYSFTSHLYIPYVVCLYTVLIIKLFYSYTHYWVSICQLIPVLIYTYVNLDFCFFLFVLSLIESLFLYYLSRYERNCFVFEIHKMIGWCGRIEWMDGFLGELWFFDLKMRNNYEIISSISYSCFTGWFILNRNKSSLFHSYLFELSKESLNSEWVYPLNIWMLKNSNFLYLVLWMDETSWTKCGLELWLRFQ